MKTCVASWGRGAAGELSKAFRSEMAGSCITQRSEEREGQHGGLCVVKLLHHASVATVGWAERLPFSHGSRPVVSVCWIM